MAGTVTTKGKGKTTVAVVGQPTQTTTATTPSAISVTPMQTPAITLPDLGIRFAKPKAQKAKSDRPFCDHVDGKGRGCQLRQLSGFAQCVNHVAAESRLTEDEAAAIVAWKTELTDAEWVRFVARTLGWWKAKLLVKGGAEGDALAAELIA